CDETSRTENTLSEAGEENAVSGEVLTKPSERDLEKSPVKDGVAEGFPPPISPWTRDREASLQPVFEETNGGCVLCGERNETRDHLFFVFTETLDEDAWLWDGTGILKPGYHFGLAKICYSEESYCQFSFHHFGEVKQLELRMCTSGHVI
ncbi:unnamed protein product, partial [Brassica oleracea var. botrytis]